MHDYTISQLEKTGRERGEDQQRLVDTRITFCRELVKVLETGTTEEKAKALAGVLISVENQIRVATTNAQREITYR